MSKEFKEFLKEEMNREAEEIMREVEQDPETADLEAPPEIKEKLWEQIRQYEEEQAHKKLSLEEQELLQLGRVYKRRRKYRKYLVLAASLIMVMALGVTSIGGPKRVVEVVERMMGDRKQVTVNTDSDKIESIDIVDEEEAYEAIEREFGFAPIRLYYMPVGVEFKKAKICEDLQVAQVIYQGEEGKRIVFRIKANYRVESTNVDYEDELVDEYIIQHEKTVMKVRKYWIVENMEERWSVQFSYKDKEYFLVISGLEKVEFEKIVENLEFY